MKTSGFKLLLTAVAIGLSSISLQAQDDDGIYGDIYTLPEVEEEMLDTSSSPLDGYSTVDDYYPEGGYDQNNNSNQSNSEQYVDEDGNTIINYNYYGDYYEDDNDFAYASRIRRFHRNNWDWGYYDPWYTNMYYYTYDPYYWGTSIYVGYWSNYNWYWNNNLTWAWGWGYQFGWGSPYYSPACYAGGGWNYWGWNNWGWNNWGWGNSYWNGYNNGYWNGFNDGLAYGGYYNTYDPYSGIYYGPRGGSAQGGRSTISTGYRKTSLAEAYNNAALEGKVSHANRSNVLQTADGKPVKGNLDSYSVRDNSRTATAAGNGSDSRPSTVNVDRSRSSEPSRTGLVKPETNTSRNGAADRTSSTSSTGKNPYQRTEASRTYNSSNQRDSRSSVDRSRSRSVPPSRQSYNTPSRTYDRNDQSSRYNNTRPSATQPNTNYNRGNKYQDIQRTRPSTDYQRGNSNSNSNRYSTPSRSGGNRNNQYSQPQRQQVPPRNYQAPQRSTTPERTAPSRSTQPSRSVTPNRNSQPSRSVTPNKGGSSGNYSSPSRGSSGSYSAPSRSSGGYSGGKSSSPSRGSSSGSRSGRP